MCENHVNMQMHLNPVSTETRTQIEPRSQRADFVDNYQSQWLFETYPKGDGSWNSLCERTMLCPPIGTSCPIAQLLQKPHACHYCHATISMSAFSLTKLELAKSSLIRYVVCNHLNCWQQFPWGNGDISKLPSYLNRSTLIKLHFKWLALQHTSSWEGHCQSCGITAGKSEKMLSSFLEQPQLEQ